VSRSFLDKLKEYLEAGYDIDKVLLAGNKTETPALSIHIVGDIQITLPICPYEQIPEVKDFINQNYPDVPFIQR
jgi:hypothetical protein